MSAVKVPSLSHRHSNRVEAHKHKVQSVNPHSLTSPSLPYTASEQLFIEREKGEARSPLTPSEDTKGLATRHSPALSPKTTYVLIFNTLLLILVSLENACFFMSRADLRRDDQTLSYCTEHAVCCKIKISQVCCDSLWLMELHL